eukprot:m.186057 g.186057  ORF g.186057 m.186057 type:complete len:920 (+) comp16694_c5_seq1:339-3098(+)
MADEGNAVTASLPPPTITTTTTTTKTTSESGDESEASIVRRVQINSDVDQISSQPRDLPHRKTHASTKSKSSLLGRRGNKGKPAPVSSGDESDGGDSIEKSRRLRREKTGHRTLNTITGEVSYKKVKSTELMQAIQMGMRQAIGYTMQKRKRDILMQDFQEVESVYYPKEGTATTPPHKFENFKFYTYAPRAYRHFREIFGIDTADFLLSMCHKPLRELSNPGASGSLFWLSHDDQFIVKTIQNGEHKFLLKLLPQYYLNLHQNKRTLLPKFFAHFCYKSSSGRHIRFIVMNNILPSHLTYEERYDLKGSTKGRFASAKEKEKKSPTLKDLDFNDIHPHGLTLPRRTYERLCNTLHRDCLILRSYKIMDYSLLLGVHNLTKMRNARLALPTSAHQFTVATRGQQQEYLPHAIIITGGTGNHERINGRYNSTTSTDSTGHARYIKVLEQDIETNRLYLSYSSSERTWVISEDPTALNLLALLPTTHAQPVSDEDTFWQVLDDGVAHEDRDISSTLGRQRMQQQESADLPRQDDSNSSLKRRMSLTYQLEDESVLGDQEEGGLYAYNEKGEKLLIFVGIIDILQNYGLRKKLEHSYKSVVYDGDSVSVHRPGFYQKRFQDYLTQRVFRQQEGNEKGQDGTEAGSVPKNLKRRNRQSVTRGKSRSDTPLEGDSPRRMGVTLMSDSEMAIHASREGSPRLPHRHHFSPSDSLGPGISSATHRARSPISSASTFDAEKSGPSSSFQPMALVPDTPPQDALRGSSSRLAHEQSLSEHDDDEEDDADIDDDEEEDDNMDQVPETDGIDQKSERRYSSQTPQSIHQTQRLSMSGSSRVPASEDVPVILINGPLPHETIENGVDSEYSMASETQSKLPVEMPRSPSYDEPDVNEDGRSGHYLKNDELVSDDSSILQLPSDANVQDTLV